MSVPGLHLRGTFESIRYMVDLKLGLKQPKWQQKWQICPILGLSETPIVPTGILEEPKTV